MKIGYARISSPDQNIELQIEALKKAGCDKIIQDKISGSVAERPGLKELQAYLREGDTVVVWRLDRLGRSLKHLLEWVNDLKQKDVNFQSLQEAIDTQTATGTLIFHLFASLAEFERNLIKERAKAGLDIARARGRLGGRPKKLPQAQRRLAIDLYKGKKHSLDHICKAVGISKPTLYKYIYAEEKSQSHKT